MKSSGLGKGLSALIPTNLKKDFSKTKGDKKNSKPTTSPKKKREDKSFEIPISQIKPNIHQPRKKFNQEQLESLADSIKDHGILQPIIIRQKSKGNYQIIAGERRYRAAKLIGLKTIPALIKTSDDLNQLELAIIENIQRENLNPIEEAQAYQQLMQEFSLTQEEISRKVKKGRSSIANLLRFLTLPQEIQDGLMENKINEGHAKVIAALGNPEAQIALFKKTLKDNLTVRNVEEIAEEISVRPHKRKIRKTFTSPLNTQREKTLSDAFGLKVKIKPGRKGGKIIISYFSENDLDRLVQQLNEEKT